MIYKNWQYKGFSFSDYLSNETGIVLTDVIHDTSVRTDIFNRANNHGTFTSNSLAGGRVFLFKGVIYAHKVHGLAFPWEQLKELISVEGNPSDNAYHDLYFETLDGQSRFCKAKVLQMPSKKREVGSLCIEFEFQLYCQDYTVIDPRPQEAEGFTGLLGGITLNTVLPTPLNTAANSIKVVNSGNAPAAVVLEINGAIINPHILNITNGRHYASTGTFSSYKMDTSNQNPNTNRFFSVTDSGIDISSKREHGQSIILSKGENEIVVLHDGTDAIPLKLSFYSTYTI